MKILYFTRDYTPHDHRFLSALAQTEHQVAYLRLERRGHTLEDRALPPQVEQVPWKGGQQPFTYAQVPALLSDLKRVIRQFQPDVIQAGPIQTAAFLVALAGFPRLVSMSWGYDLMHDAERTAFMRWSTRFTLQRSAALVGDCLPVRQQARKFGMPEARIVTFPWGVTSSISRLRGGGTSPPAKALRRCACSPLAAGSRSMGWRCWRAALPGQPSSWAPRACS